MRFFKILVWTILVALVPFGTPQLLSYASGIGTAHSSWSTARRDRTYISPSPALFKPAVIQVFAAKTWGWRGAFAVHTWISIKEKGAPNFTRFEVIGWRAYRGGSALTISRGYPDNYWFGNRPELLVDIRGQEAEPIIDRIKALIADYPHKKEYRLWPGPNSNSFIAHIGRQIPALKLDLPPTAIGKDYIAGGKLLGPPISGDGFQFSLFGYAGFSYSSVQGIEFHLFGLTTGFDFDDMTLKLPGFGRIPIKNIL
ncbi:MAG: DUF3750 domain-containing protein [Sneathiella sp.]|nr:DUF3750 domain-containing protein [Sneathiella sp.]